MCWFLAVGVAAPAVLVSLVLLEDRYAPWMKRRQSGLWLAGEFVELVAAVTGLFWGVPGAARWISVACSAILAGLSN